MSERPSGVVERGWRSVGAVAGWQTAASLCYYSVFAATDFLREGFGLSRALVGVVVATATLGYTVALFPAGAAVDGLGERRLMLVGLAGLALATVAVALAPSTLGLLAAVFVLGAAYSPAMPASNRGILASAPRGREALAMGLKQVGVTAGSAAASLLVTGLAALAAWRTGFYTVAGVAVAYGVAFAVLYPGRAPSGWHRPDLRGLAGDRPYVLLVAAGLFVGATIYTLLGYLVLYMDDVARVSPVVAGGVLALTQVVGSASRVGAGELADRLGGARGSLTVALGQVALGAGVFAALATTPDGLAVAAALFCGLGITVYGSTGVYYSALGSLVASEDLGTATAGGQTLINVGGLLVPPLFGLLADTAGYGAGWGLLAGLTLVAALLLAGVRRLV